MKWEANATPRPLCPWEREPIPIVKEAGWAQRPVWTGAENFAPRADRSARNECYTDYATRPFSM